MAFRDLDEFLTVKPLVLPIGGKEYAFPGVVSAHQWLVLQRINEKMRGGAEIEALSDTEEADLMAEMFGDAKDEMIANGVNSAQIQRVFFTLLAYHMNGGGARGSAAAELVWNAQGEAPAPNRATRRKATAKSARSRGSRAGTTSVKKKEPSSPGTTSSKSGER